MKPYLIKKEHADEAAGWLKENVSAENVRWWWNAQQSRSWKSSEGWSSDPVIWIDVTEEELPQLMWFAMKWSNRE